MRRRGLYKYYTRVCKMRDFTHNFSEDLEVVLDAIDARENFAMPRYADGEYNVIHKINCGGLDGWRITENDTVFSTALFNTLDHTEDDYRYGISCRCCDPPKLEYFQQRLSHKPARITFSNLFVNSNHDRFCQWVSTMGRPVVLIANSKCFDAEYPFETLERSTVSDDVIAWYQEDPELRHWEWGELASKYNNELFLISAGPLSEIIVHELYTKNPNNTYIDVGSAIDPWTHKTFTRGFQNPNSPYRNTTCHF